jgi:iron complex outermembrane recepter protein
MLACKSTNEANSIRGVHDSLSGWFVAWDNSLLHLHGVEGQCLEGLGKPILRGKPLNPRFDVSPRMTGLLLSAILLSFRSVSAQTALTSDSIKYSLPSVEIVGEVLRPTETMISSVQIESFKQEKMSGSFLFLPGIVRAPEQGAGDEIVVRGISQKRVNIYYNGVPIRSNTTNSLPLDGLLFFNADNVILDKGTPSLFYGANSSGNVLSINSSPFSEKEFAVEGSASRGNNEKQSYALKLSGYSNVLHYSISGGYFYRKSFRLSDKFTFVPSQTSLDRVNSDQNNLELMATATAVLSSDHIYSIFGSFNTSEYGRPASTVRPRYGRMNSWKNGFVGLKGSSSFDAGWKMESILYYTTLKDSLARYNDASLKALSSTSYWYDQTFGGRVQCASTLDDQNKILFSLDIKRDLHTQDWHTKASTRSTTTIAACEYQNRSIQELELVLGVSHNWLMPNYVSERTEVERQNYAAFNYQSLVTYKPKSLQLAFHLGVNHTTIFPATTDVFGDAMRSDPTYTILPNPDLKEEQNTNIDAGVKWRSPENNYNVDVAFYYNAISDLIKAINLTDSTEQSINIDAARNVGIDLCAQFRIDRTLTTYLSYSYLKARNVSSDRTSDFLEYLPEHQLKSFSSYEPYPFLGVDLSVTYVSKRYYALSGEWQSLPRYWLMDAGVNSHISSSIILYTKVSNVLDEDYQVSNGFPQPGREYVIGVRLKY